MNNTIQNIELSKLIPGKFHAPSDYENDNLENLINSIKKYGIIEPLLVRPLDEEYEIILGNRRFNAAKSLGLETVPAIIANLDDTKALDLIISDNVHRKEFTETEEGYLYDQALSRQDSNLEELSNNIGVSEDRITSKLNLFKKNNQKEEQESNNFIEDDNNNYINNDIINLSNLNKKEEERDDFIMNNNQFINNEELNTNITSNQNIAQTPTPEPNPEPTFGGQFFPSIDNELTNMNPNITMEKDLPTNNTEPNISPLIDLTNTTNPIPSPTENTIPSPNMNISSQTIQTQPTPPSTIEQSTPIQQSPPITQSQPVALNSTLPNTEKIEESQVVTPQPVVETAPMQEPVSNPTNIQTQNQQNQPPSETNAQYTNIPPQISMPDLDIQMPTIEKEQPIISAPNLPNDTTLQQPDPSTVSNLNIPNIETPVSSPVLTSQPQAEIPTVQASNPTLESTQNIPSPTPTTSDLDSPISLQTIPKKDIIPVINMFKTLATSVEAFGYKLNVEESEDMNNYTISIIVEK